jgi:hypothetical protein
MKRLYYQQDGGNYPSTKNYYTFETEEEYNQFVEQLKTKKSRAIIRFDVPIICEPRVVVSDGFATYGGKRIKGRGCEECWSGTYTQYYFYLNPATIEQDEVAKIESWWV